MIIKKFTAKTETEAIELAKEELGNEAVIMNIKTIKPKGIAKLFSKEKVEVTAALDENIVYDSKETKRDENQAKNTEDRNDNKENRSSYRPDILLDEQEKDSALEEKLDNLQQLLEKQMKENPKKEEKREDESEKENKSEDEVDSAKTKVEACKELVIKQLIENEVDEKLAKGLLDEIYKTLPKDSTVDQILATVYQKIILMLGQPYTIDPSKENYPKFVFFLGSTGVGKTTTIAKIASKLKIEKKLKVCLVTADTYRIAAVEQLKTYANILGVPLKVVYTAEELGGLKEELAEYDICLIDTAGRSQKNKEQLKDITELLDQIPVSEREVYLVLNAGTKYKDLKEIATVYKDITDYSMIFTKLDETSCQGIMFNMKIITKQPLSYVTWGQNVPDDIGEIDAQKVAKKLLGGKS